MIWKCKNCGFVSYFPMEKCMGCFGEIEELIPKKFTVLSVAQSNVKTLANDKVPYNVLLLQDEFGNYSFKKTFRNRNYNEGDILTEEPAKDNSAVAASKIKYSIYAAVERCIRLSGLEIKPNSKILIKPNLSFPLNFRTAVVTNPEVIDAILRCVIKNGANPKNITIAESSIEGVSSELVAKKNGLLDITDKYKVVFKDINNYEFVPKIIEHEGKKYIFEISKLIFESDIIINVPVVKTHVQTGVSLSLKNMKGVVNLKTRKMMHMLGLHLPIALLYKVLPSFFTVGDGTIALEGDGPGDTGKPVNYNMVFASRNALAFDIMVSRLIGMENIGHISIANSMQKEKTEPFLVGEEEEIISREFKKPGKRITPLKNIYLTEGLSCSGCSNNLWFASRKLESLKKNNPQKEIHVVIGKHFCKESLKGKQVYAIGSCAISALADEKDITALGSVPGCSPKIEDIKKFLEEVFQDGN